MRSERSPLFYREAILPGAKRPILRDATASILPSTKCSILPSPHHHYLFPQAEHPASTVMVVPVTLDAFSLNKKLTA